MGAWVWVTPFGKPLPSSDCLHYNCEWDLLHKGIRAPEVSSQQLPRCCPALLAAGRSKHLQCLAHIPTPGHAPDFGWTRHFNEKACFVGAAEVAGGRPRNERLPPEAPPVRHNVKPLGSALVRTQWVPAQLLPQGAGHIPASQGPH